MARAWGARGAGRALTSSEASYSSAPRKASRPDESELRNCAALGGE
jgi:hypothetical protein